jgi:quercetin dioxygenase-like cupin family protein
MKTALTLTTLATISLAALTALGGPAAKPERHVTPADLSWVQPYGPKGPAFGFVEGQFNDKKPASLFIKMAAGGDSGWHFHDETYSAVVIQGSFSEQQAGEKAEVALPAGSYFTQPGKAVHRNGCAKGTDCVVYIHFDAGANSVPTTREGKVVTPPQQ